MNSAGRASDNCSVKFISTNLCLYLFAKFIDLENIAPYGTVLKVVAAKL